MPSGQDHVFNGAPVFVVVVSLDGDFFFSEGELRATVPGSLAVDLAFIYEVCADEAEASQRYPDAERALR